jgi:DNA polymerase IV
VRTEASLLHLDLDAFFAAVEQRDKPSLRGRPVIVGGLGPRGVVSTASYEAREYGVRSAMRMAEARARCPHAAFLSGRFAAYRLTSRAVMEVLRAVSPLVEPVSLDEAYVDLTAGQTSELSTDAVARLARDLKNRIHEVTGGLTASIGAGTSKLVAKVASELGKPDGLVVVAPGTETELLHPLPVASIPGVGPATRERLRRIGVHSVGDLARTGERELVGLLGKAHGHALARLARAEDDRPVTADRESKSISVEDTFDHDIADQALLGLIVDRLTARVCERLVQEQLSGRTLTVKVRLYDFTTHTRSATAAGPTDDVRPLTRLARQLLAEVDTSAGVRLLGVGVSGLADWVQGDLFAQFGDAGDSPRADAGIGAADRPGPGDPGSGDPASGDPASGDPGSGDPGSGDPGSGDPGSVDAGSVDAGAGSGAIRGSAPRRWTPGADVVHAAYGPGWVWGAGRGRVTVRFETATGGTGGVRTFAEDDPDLAPYTPLTWPRPDRASSTPPSAGPTAP